MTISIVTPWYQHPELRAVYEAATAGAQVIIIETLQGTPFSFAAACNQGLAQATGDVIMFLNNDVSADPGWLAQAERDVMANPNALLGPATDVRGLAGRALLYVEGWCIAAQRDVWEKLGGWDAETFKRPYWEDVDLSWRATKLGIALRRRPWPVRHISNVTSDSVPGAKDGSDANRDALESRIAEYDATQGVARI